ncbi:MAG: NAD(P)/FAD-dependent oxidoreductase [Parabacteroides sp.]|nr:NAD(P)/FAD-dependent oxidoreductase [Parabacteroides sp.]
MKYDVIIIGSGLGGLECAHILSRAGMHVLVLERGKQAGGCMQSYKRHGLYYDTGFHYIGGLKEGQSLHATFKHLGLLDLPWQRLDDEFDRITIGEKSYSFTQGYDAFVKTLLRDFPSERKGLEKYVNLLKHYEEKQFDMLNPHIQETAVYSTLFETGAWNYLVKTIQDPLLIDVLSGTCLKMELRKESLPLFSFVHGNSSFIESSWRLKGDSSLIVNSLIKDINSFGGKVICNAEVIELTEENGVLKYAQCSNGERYEGKLFISNAHPLVTCHLIRQTNNLRKRFCNRIYQLENTNGMLTVSLRIKQQALEYFNWNQYIYQQPGIWTSFQEEGSIDRVLVSCKTPKEGNKYVEQIDLLTPMAWKKCEPWFHTQIGQRGEAYQQMKERMADECIALAEQFIPGLHQMVMERYISTPLTYRDYTLTPDGSAYGIRKDFNSPMTTILSPRTPISNLYMTGQNLMLHGIHGVTMTALFTCAELLGKDYIWNIIKNE